MAWTPDYFVRYVSLPFSIDGVTLPNHDGTFDIYLNECHSDEKQKETLEHEIEHIIRDHFYNDVKSLQQIENEANKKEQEQKKIICFSSLDAVKKFVEYKLQRSF